MEDLQFQLEEQGVISGDKLETVEEGTQATLAQLKEQLAREREKLETVEEGTQASLAQLEEQLAREREDNATLREQLQVHATQQWCRVLPSACECVDWEAGM